MGQLPTMAAMGQLPTMAAMAAAGGAAGGGGMVTAIVIGAPSAGADADGADGLAGGGALLETAGGTGAVPALPFCGEVATHAPDCPGRAPSGTMAAVCDVKLFAHGGCDPADAQGAAVDGAPVPAAASGGGAGAGAVDADADAADAGADGSGAGAGGAGGGDGDGSNFGNGVLLSLIHI